MLDYYVHGECESAMVKKVPKGTYLLTEQMSGTKKPQPVMNQMLLTPKNKERVSRVEGGSLGYQ